MPILPLITMPNVEDTPRLIHDLNPHANQLSPDAEHGARCMTVQALYAHFPVPASSDDLSKDVTVVHRRFCLLPCSRLLLHAGPAKMVKDVLLRPV
jgi:hypothetical protein